MGRSIIFLLLKCIQIKDSTINWFKLNYKSLFPNTVLIYDTKNLKCEERSDYLIWIHSPCFALCIASWTSYAETAEGDSRLKRLATKINNKIHTNVLIKERVWCILGTVKVQSELRYVKEGSKGMRHGWSIRQQPDRGRFWKLETWDFILTARGNYQKLLNRGNT